jgi:hypothetical protein
MTVWQTGVFHDRKTPRFSSSRTLASSTIVRLASFHAPFTLRSKSSRQPEQLVIRLQVRAVHQKRGLGLHLTVLQRCGVEIASPTISIA